MQQTKIPVEAILGMTATNSQAKTILHPKKANHRNWRVLSLWRELRRHKIAYYFLSWNQISIEPIAFYRPGFVVSIHKVPVPGAAFTIDYYAAKSNETGNEFCSPSISGSEFIKKLVHFSFLHESELKGVPREPRYEPYRYCPVCGERCRLTDYTCELCGAKLP